MTKKLHTLLELPDDSESELDLSEPVIEQEPEYSESTLSNLEKIEAALPQVRGLEASDTELDTLAELATETFKDLRDLGFQVESRFSSEIFSAAGNMLGHAIQATTAKINKKLRMIDQQLKKAQLDAKLSAKQEEVDNTPLGEGKALDRNELLKLYSDRDKNTNKDK
jgi:CRISPR/Cas system CMR-associated protein Cmr5 small subunit